MLKIFLYEWQNFNHSKIMVGFAVNEGRFFFNQIYFKRRIVMKEKEYYDEIANWSFENINYKTERNCKWDFYGEIKKYTDDNSICLDLGTGGGEKLLKNYPNVKMVICTDFS
jgi:hypothetical protein